MTPFDAFLSAAWQVLFATALWTLLITILTAIGIMLEPLREDKQ
jgi:hypothetical protein